MRTVEGVRRRRDEAGGDELWVYIHFTEYLR